MRLSNFLTIRLSAVFIFILLIWSVVYFFIQMNEIYDGIDEGLNNLKQELILEANNTPHFMENMSKYEPLNLIIEKIPYEEAVNIKESYITTTVYFQSESEYEEVRMLVTAFLCSQDNQYYKVKFFTSTVESDDMVKNMFILLLTLWVVLSLMLIIAIKIIINRSNKPFYSLLENLRNFRLNETKMIDFPETSISEYSDMNRSVKELLNNNIDVYSEQKYFIENASHELQTPIAVATTKLELLMDDKNLTQEQLEHIYSVINTLRRAKRLNNSLLLLSKIRNKQFTTNEPIDLSVIVDDVLEGFQALTEHKALNVVVDKEGIPGMVMNKDLAYILLNNLVKNAIVHNLAGGEIKITLTNNSILIRNTGNPLPEGVDIFERYFTQSNTVRLSGLGLSIVKSIAEQYNIKLSHSYNNGLHTIKLLLK